MLVLSRRVGEKIVIGDGITIEVLSVSGEGVRLGVVAPRETTVYRHEVYAEIEEANKAAQAVLEGMKQTSTQEITEIVRVGHCDTVF